MMTLNEERNLKFERPQNPVTSTHSKKYKYGRTEYVYVWMRTFKIKIHVLLEKEWYLLE